MPRLPAPRIPTGSVYYRRGGGRKEVGYRYLIEDVVEKNLELGRAESGLFLFPQQASFAKEKPPVHGFYPLFCAWDKDRTFPISYMPLYQSPLLCWWARWAAIS